MTRTRLTSPSGGACMEKDLPCPAASPPPNAITDLINSRRCILGRLQVTPCTLHRLVDAAGNSQESYTDESRWGLGGFGRGTFRKMANAFRNAFCTSWSRPRWLVVNPTR